MIRRRKPSETPVFDAVGGERALARFDREWAKALEAATAALDKHTPLYDRLGLAFVKVPARKPLRVRGDAGPIGGRDPFWPVARERFGHIPVGHCAELAHLEVAK